MRTQPETSQKLRRRQGGFSLIEAVVASGLLGLVIVGSMATITNGIKLTDRSEQSEDLVIAAQSLLEEVRVRAFEDPVSPVFGRETGESATNKTTWDDVDDFCGYTENVVLTQSGATNPTLSDLRLAVKVFYLPATDADGQSDTDALTSNDNGTIQFNLNAAAPANACTTPGASSRFKIIEVTATSTKYSDVNRNVKPLVLRTLRFK